MARATLFTFASGKGTKVRGLRLDTPSGPRVRVTWYQGAQPKSKDFPDTDTGLVEAKAFAKGVYDQKVINPRIPSKLTVRELWQAYRRGTFLSLREKTRKNYKEQWSWFEQYVGPAKLVEKVNAGTLDELRTHLREQMSARSAKDVFDLVKRIWKWGFGRELLTVNRVAAWTFKMGKEERAEARAEYTPDERDQLIKQLDPTKATQWRAWVALTLCGAQGIRQHSALHLQWSDITLDGQTVTWRSEYAKTGEDFTQPLRARARTALEVALQWRERMGYAGPWVLPTARTTSASEVYTIQSLYWSLRAAEARAGITHKTGRGGHGLRKTLARDVAGLTGSAMAGLHAIGNRDMRTAEKYEHIRLDELRRNFEQLDAAESFTREEPAMKPGNENGAPMKDAPLTLTEETTSHVA